MSSRKIGIIGVFNIVVLLISVLAQGAEPQMIYDKDQRPIAIIGLEDVLVNSPGWENHLRSFEVQEVVYEGASDIVTGIRVKPIRGVFDFTKESITQLIILDTRHLCHLDSSWVSTLVKPGSRLLIAYSLA